MFIENVERISTAVSLPPITLIIQLRPHHPRDPQSTLAELFLGQTALAYRAILSGTIGRFFLHLLVLMIRFCTVGLGLCVFATAHALDRVSGTTEV